MYNVTLYENTVSLKKKKKEFFLLICISPRNAGVDLLNIPLMNARLEPKSGLKVLKRKDSKAILALVLLSASGRKKAIC